MKRKAVLKMTAVLLTGALILEAMPVSAKTVSENGAGWEQDDVLQELQEDTSAEEDLLQEEREANLIDEESVESLSEATSKELYCRVELDGITYSIYAIYEDGGKTYTAEVTGDSPRKEIVIPSSVKTDIVGSMMIPVTGIQDYAFQDNSELTSIIISEGVTNIGECTFDDCINLSNITIPDSVTNIGDYAFCNCSSLTGITIPGSVEVIGENAFLNCTSLESIQVAEKNTVYDSRDNCNAIVETKTNKLLFGCKNTIIPDTVTEIGNYAFCNCSGLTNIVIPESVTNIGDSAFSRCSGLTSIVLLNGIESIGYDAFYDCSSLTSIIIPSSVTSVGSRLVFGCRSLESIQVAEGNTVYDSRDNCNAIIETKTNKLILGCKNTFIPNDVSSIEEYAFGTCIGLTDIVIPGSVEKIGESAFSDCTNLEEITLSNGIKSIGEWAFASCDRLKTLFIPESITNIGSLAFFDCSGLTDIEVADENTVYDSRNDCNAIIEKKTGALILGSNNTVIPNDVSIIEEAAFYKCNELKKITLSENVTSIGEEAFNGCSGLADLTIPSSVKSIGRAAFTGCSGLEEIKVAEDNTVYDSRNNCNAIIEKNTNALIAGCKNTVIPNGVTKIGDNAFSGCSGLTNITFPNGITELGTDAFSYCSGLTSVVIPIGVEDIQRYTFAYCSELTSVIIPVTVTHITNDAFTNCTKLKNVYYCGSQQQWNEIGIERFAFYDQDKQEIFSYSLHCDYEYPGQSQTPIDPSQPPKTDDTPDESDEQGGSSGSSDKTNDSLSTPEKPSGETPIQSNDTQSDKSEVVLGTTLKETSGRTYKITSKGSNNQRPTVALTRLSAKDKKAKKVTIPSTITVDQVTYDVTEIGSKTFRNNKKIQSVVIPASVTKIGSNSFEGCGYLKSITISKSVTSIGKNAFKNCKNLKKITIKSEKVKYIGKGAFSGIHKKCVIKVPKKQYKRYKILFKGRAKIFKI